MQTIQEVIQGLSRSDNAFVQFADMIDIFNNIGPNIEHDEIRAIMKDELTYVKEWMATKPEKHFIANLVVEWVFRWKFTKDNKPKWYAELRDANALFSLTTTNTIDYLLELL